MSPVFHDADGKAYTLPERNASGNLLHYDSDGRAYTVGNVDLTPPESLKDAEAALEQAKARIAEYEATATQAAAARHRVLQKRAAELTPADQFEEWRSLRLSQEAQEWAARVRDGLSALEQRVRVATNRSYAAQAEEQAELQRKYVAAPGQGGSTNHGPPLGWMMNPQGRK